MVVEDGNYFDYCASDVVMRKYGKIVCSVTKKLCKTERGVEQI